MQIELWQQRSHLFCVTREQRQDPALEALLQPTNTGSLDLYRATAGRQSAWLPIAVAITGGRIDNSFTLIPPSAEELGHFLLGNRLDANLDLISNPPFQGLSIPGRSAPGCCGTRQAIHASAATDGEARVLAAATVARPRHPVSRG